ncbi:hypothetical protein MK079_00655 [Candidatus Gracilibacteria bacterium]|nr:hypothetical protein [Candidatus Gracilibacteria bacterium]
MKHIFLIVLVFFTLTLESAFAGWGSWTQINNSRQFNKVNGVHTLYIQQPAYINPFANSRITRDQFNNYTVDGRIFNRNHSLWRYNNNGVPNQNVLSTRRNSKVYRYDTTLPVCGSVTLYARGVAFDPVNWTNQDVTASLSCIDTLSGCQNSSISGLVMSHGDAATPNTTLTDRAGNNNTCSSTLSNGRSVLIDQRLPAVTAMTFGGTDLSSQSEFEAGRTQFSFSIIDRVTTNYGVSGIKSYDFSLNYLADHAGNARNTQVCQRSQTYPSYNPNGSLNADDIQHDTIDCSNVYSAGQYRVDLEVTDDAGNTITESYPLTIYPNDESISRTVELISPTSGALYANNSDAYVYRVTLQGAYGNPIYNKTITSVNQDGNESGFQTLVTNMVDTTGGDAVIEISSLTTNNNGQFDVNVRSLSPGVFSESFRVALNGWGDDYNNNTVSHDFYVNSYGSNSFRKPFIGSLGINDDALKLSKTQQSNLSVTQNSCALCGAYSIGNYIDSFDATGNGFVIEAKQNESGLSTNPSLDFVLNHDGENVMDIDDLGIQTVPHISYNLGGSTVRYVLTQTDSAFDTDPISYNGGVFYGLHILGNLQGQGKQTVTGQEENFSDITKLELRQDIEQNAYELTQGMTSGQILGGVKYVEGDYDISSAPIDYETLIVSGNLTIDNNISSRVGIIVLAGNIEIENHVTDVQAMIYADGALLSDGSSETQLRITGNIFTRNTIGGALGDGNNYILPGGGLTSDYDSARSYDLNFLRIGNAGWDKNANGIQDSDEYENTSTLVIYDPENQINPPKGFESR